MQRPRSPLKRNQYDAPSRTSLSLIDTTGYLESSVQFSAILQFLTSASLSKFLVSFGRRNPSPLGPHVDSAYDFRAIIPFLRWCGARSRALCAVFHFVFVVLCHRTTHRLERWGIV